MISIRVRNDLESKSCQDDKTAKKTEVGRGSVPCAVLEGGDGAGSGTVVGRRGAGANWAGGEGLGGESGGCAGNSHCRTGRAAGRAFALGDSHGLTAGSCGAVGVEHQLPRALGPVVRVVGVLTSVEAVGGAVGLQSTVVGKRKGDRVADHTNTNVRGDHTEGSRVLAKLIAAQCFVGSIVAEVEGGVAVCEEDVAESGTLVESREGFSVNICVGRLGPQRNLVGHGNGSSGSESERRGEFHGLVN
ncbi:hypothetical protein OGAPHI_006481 [Ogataea philodendri]|uniref:Uncharacterized protein n=1 Tax=Ogataea philodendri TaxID=1378263 RepID=A0A9P8NYM0_9ASCO|nr:uncharacterized protein OGAPHI_006481 [Ogataea philodendri]KAH3661631.1 hypothetical protein OGAPHI_006481 [Ogataea philodendri]